MASNISEVQKAGELDRRVQLLGLTYTKVKGEAIPAYGEILNCKARKTEAGGREEVKAGSTTNVGETVWRIYYNTQVTVEPKSYEAIKLAEVIDAPVYLLDLDSQIMYDLFGNPLVSIEDSITILYDIKHVEEVGRRVAMDLICERWR